MKGIRSVFRFIFSFACGCPVVLATFVKKRVCSIILPLIFCQG